MIIKYRKKERRKINRRDFIKLIPTTVLAWFGSKFIKNEPDESHWSQLENAQWLKSKYDEILCDDCIKSIPISDVWAKPPIGVNLNERTSEIWVSENGKTVVYFLGPFGEWVKASEISNGHTRSNTTVYVETVI